MSLSEKNKDANEISRKGSVFKGSDTRQIKHTGICTDLIVWYDVTILPSNVPDRFEDWIAAL